MSAPLNRLIFMIICSLSNSQFTSAAETAQSQVNPAATKLIQAQSTTREESVSSIESPAATPEKKLLLKPGQPISAGMQTEGIVVTYDVNLAKEQVAAYSDSPEASFVLAVALTRTSMVEEALHEVRRARKLSEAKGGPAYFDHMINEYEEMLTSYPNDNRIRYGLAWAYYMKAYVLTHYGKSIIGAAAKQATTNTNVTNSIKNSNWHDTWVASLLQPKAELADKTKKSDMPTNDTLANKIESNYREKNDWHNVPPPLVPQVKSYYEKALSKLDEILAREPNDIWTRSYRTFLYCEYSGDLNQAIDVWKNCLTLAPNNPAAYFFLGESYLQQGNLKECLHNLSKAVALRALPN